MESVADGAVGFQPISGNDSSDRVQEGFAELLVPVLKDLPAVHHLNLELGYRHSDYDFAGKVSTWKALGDWALTPDLRIRGGYQKANRAPNLVELFQKNTGSGAVRSWRSVRAELPLFVECQRQRRRQHA